MTTVRIPADAITTLQDTLLQDDRERIAFCPCSASGDSLLVSSVDPVPADEMAVMTPTRCAVTEATDRQFIEHCLATDRHPLIVHSHPAGPDRFTDQDQDAIAAYTWITDLVDDLTILFGVLTPSQFHITQWDPATETPVPVPARIIGAWTLSDPPEIQPTTETETDTVDPAVYDRNIRCFLEPGQQALADTHVAVVGCGGIGSLLAQHLAGLGVQTVTFIDPDQIESSNLPRIPQARQGDTGAYKVSILQEQYVQRVPDAATTAVTTPVQDAASYLQDVDVILAGLDRITPRMWLNRYATEHLTPYIDAGSRIDITDDQVTDMAAYIQTIAPGTDTACFDCLDRGDTETMRREHLSRDELEDEVEQGYIAETALSPEPAVIHLNGIAASLAAETLTKLVTGYDTPPSFLHYDGLHNDLARLTTHRNTHCYTCTRFTATGDTTPPADDPEIDLPRPRSAQTDTQSVYQIPDAVTAYFDHL
ncbi:ThiF family adenylyltransferase [Natronococcus sp. A-GB1]|uniref:ThiF family adenylyltransferase n=1 Tax=Natronococcus sp. A-GB1 TaxID=3037648 RepID=UPI0024200152|nr:ThiF family adenylyltransferase [Natronococcus sp. A-GB1]MDG5761325.1 ThiF family adenylyltransferase [Natronococcus sp. A-GB1]